MLIKISNINIPAKYSIKNKNIILLLLYINNANAIYLLNSYPSPNAIPQQYKITSFDSERS